MITDQMVEKALDRWFDGPVDRDEDQMKMDMRAVLTAALGDAGWQDISTAPKDGSEIDLWCLNVADKGEARFAAMFFNDDAQWEDWHSYILEPKWRPTYWRYPPTPTLPRHDGKDVK